MPKITKEEAKELNIPNTSVQSILINKNISINEQKKWLGTHKFKYGKHRSQKNYIRWNQLPDIKNAFFTEKHITPDIIFVYQFYSDS